MSSLAPVAPLPEVTVPLNRFVPPDYRHYFNGEPDQLPYTTRRFDFWGMAVMMPLVRAFLDTSAAEHNRDYRWLFTLLGSELALNAIQHSRSGQPEGTFTLVVRRYPEGLTLTCRDTGVPEESPHRPAAQRQYLTADPRGLEPEAESGRGLALVNALATHWGDNGFPSHHHIWFYLTTDLNDTAWAHC